jgi:hypothetical protein
MRRCPCNIKHVGDTWGISGDACYISIVLFYRYTNHVCVSHTARTYYGMSVTCHRLYVRHLYLAKCFFGEERIGPAFCHDIAYACA